jgi:hypothetical protein
MADSNARDALDATHDRNRQQRLDGIKRWVEYINAHDADEWGDQQNRLVDPQLESAQQADIDIEHRQRVEQAGRERPD